MDLNAAQIWILIGLPALGLALGLFLTRGALRSVLGYAVLLGAFIIVTLVDAVAGAVFGGIVALLYAAGRGGIAEHVDEDPLDHVAGHTGPLTRAR